ncbi:MAG TPA: response regulator, partial [Petrotogaceae bacterium]|nr:response regulator [Petrotogaceae bacterium]
STSIEFLEVEQDSIYEGDPVKLRLLLSCVLEKLLFYTESNELSIKAQKIYHDRENSYFVFSITEGRYIQSPANDEADHRTNVRDCFSECLDLASQAGGKIWTEKTDGLRKYEITFILGNTFPVSQAESLSAESFQDKLNILVVEDNEINQKLICAILKKRGWNPLVADNGLKALEVLKDKSFDIILMDVQMPYMDGYETTRRIRQSENQTVAKIPIVAMTAYAMTEHRQSCIKSGMNDYITKPVNMSDLYTIIERNLSKR